MSLWDISMIFHLLSPVFLGVCSLVIIFFAIKLRKERPTRSLTTRIVLSVLLLNACVFVVLTPNEPLRTCSYVLFRLFPLAYLGVAYLLFKPVMRKEITSRLSRRLRIQFAAAFLLIAVVMLISPIGPPHRPGVIEERGIGK